MGSRAEGPRSPLTCTSTAGIPPAFSEPSSPTASGSVRWASWLSAEGVPGSVPTSWESAPETVRWRRHRGAAQRVREGRHEGLARDRAREVAQHDRRVRLNAAVRGEIRGAGVAAAAPAGGYEHDRALRLAGGEHARELEQRGGARELRARARAGGVAVGEQHDRARAGDAGAGGDDGGERSPSFDRGRHHAAGVHGEAPRGRATRAREGAGDVGGEPRIPFAAGPALGKARSEAPQFGERARPIEGVGRERGGERRGAPAQREPRDRHGEQQGSEGGAIDASVEHRGRA